VEKLRIAEEKEEALEDAASIRNCCETSPRPRLIPTPATCQLA